MKKLVLRFVAPFAGRRRGDGVTSPGGARRAGRRDGHEARAMTELFVRVARRRVHGIAQNARLAERAR